MHRIAYSGQFPDLAWAVLMLAILDAEIVSAEPAGMREFLSVLGRRFESQAG